MEKFTFQPSDDLAWLHDNFQKKYNLKLRRIQTAFMCSAMATIGIVIALVVASLLNFPSGGPIAAKDQLSMQYLDWNPNGPQYAICSWDCEIGVQFQRLFSNNTLVVASIYALNNEGNIAGIARLCNLVAVSIAVFFAYRQQLTEYYFLNAQKAELEDFQETPQWELWLSRIAYTLATLFGTYVVVSIFWLGVDLAFKDVTLNWFDASILIIGSTAVMTFIATFGALAVTTRGILLLGLMTYLFGLTASFALTPLIDGQQWWQRAVSSAGQLNPSAPVFTGTFLSGALAMLVLWLDVNGMVRKVIADGPLLLLGARGWMNVVRVLYIAFVGGLLFVGFIRVDRINFPRNMLFHAGGAMAAIACVVMSGLIIRKRRFPPWYKAFSVYILLGVTLGITILSSFTLDPFTIVDPGTGIVSLTVLELVLLMMLGVWTYITVDNLVTIENIRALTGYTDVRAAAAISPAPIKVAEAVG